MVAVMPFVSCSNDDSETNTKKNFLKIGDTEYELAMGFSEDYSDNPNNETYNIDLSFLTSGLSVNGDDYTGDGYSIYFEMFSSTPNKLAEGKYEYNLTETSFSFDYGILYNNSNQEELEITSGTIVIVKSENDYYELTFDCVDEMDRIITGRYYGKVNYTLILEP
jgi:hypothetical protein